MLESFKQDIVNFISICPSSKQSQLHVTKNGGLQISLFQDADLQWT